MSDRVPVVRVVIADDHPLFLRSLVRMMDEQVGLEAVAAVGDGVEALAAIAEHRPDVALLDVRMPSLDGLGVARALAGGSSPTRVVLLSADDDGMTIASAIDAGAAAFVSKAAEEPEICATVLSAAAGLTALSPILQARLFERMRAAPPVSLSGREQEVLELAATGLSNTEIGRRLYVAPGTVKTHLQRAYDKLGATDRVTAIAEAIRRGLLP